MCLSCEQKRIETKYTKNTKKSEEENMIKNIRNLFKLEKENQAIKDKTMRDIKTFFEQQKAEYYKPVKFGEFWEKNILNMILTVIEIS